MASSAAFVKISDIVGHVATEDADVGALAMLLADAIAAQEATGVEEAIKSLKRAIESGDERTRPPLLDVLDTCMDSCGNHFRRRAIDSIVPMLEKLALNQPLHRRMSKWTSWAWGGSSSSASSGARPPKPSEITPVGHRVLALLQEWNTTMLATEETALLAATCERLGELGMPFPNAPARKTLQAVSSRDPLNKERGFLPYPDPLTSLPPQFIMWEQAAQLLPRLVACGHFQNLCESLPSFRQEINDLRTEEEWERAMLLLSTFAHAYVYCTPPGQDDEPMDHLPSSIAVPWIQVCDRLGRPPFLSYASHTLHNWRRVDDTEPIALGNVYTLLNITGTIDEEWVRCVHIDIEAKAAAGVNALRKIQRLIGVPSSSSDSIVSLLTTIQSSLEGMLATVSMLPARLDKYIFRKRVLPLLRPLPRELRFEGVAAGYLHRTLPPALSTVSQFYLASPSVWSLEVGLGTAPDSEEVRQQLGLLSPAHRLFVESLEGERGTAGFLQQSQGAMFNAYQECSAALGAFRSAYIDLMNPDDA